MQPHSRRDFLADVGKGMLLASVGPALASELGLSSARAEEPKTRLTFGSLEPLVSLMQETPANKLLPILVEKIRAGVELKTLTAAGALANVRAFAGIDYNGYHTFMALPPAYEMARELPAQRQALPVLKVLYRNTRRMGDRRGKTNRLDELYPLTPGTVPAGGPSGELLQAAVRRGDIPQAERVLAAALETDRGEAFNHLQYTIQDEVDVHRTVLVWRAWTMLDIAGPEHAQSLLRQTIHHCICEGEGIGTVPHKPGAIRTVLVKLLDQYKLVGKPLGTKQPDDQWVHSLAMTIARGTSDQAGEAAAAALAEGFAPEAIGEAISLAANFLVLTDGGSGPGNPNKPAGSVHGASVGVHASDAANGWRNIARVSNQRNTVASLIVGAYHTGGQFTWAPSARQPLPWSEDLLRVTSTDPAVLLKELDEAIVARQQARACAIVHKYSELGQPVRPVFDVLLCYAVSEDGALHAEKYYRTVVEEYAATRPAFRSRHVVALARVTASEYGKKADGYAEACNLLKL